MPRPIGHRVWAIAEGYIPPASTGTTRELTSHETVCILNAGSAMLEGPSLTLISMFAYVPTSVVAGVPLSSPVLLLKVAHEGWLMIEKVSVMPPGFVVVGVNA